MQREIIIDTEQKQERRVAILEDRAIEEFYIERPGQHRYIGNVYKGKVINVVPAIHAAFVDIGLEKNGFIHIDDVDISAVEAIEAEDGEERPASKPVHSRQITDLLQEGQEIVVQVVKEPLGTKGVRLTTNVSLPGRFLVFLPYEKQIAVSRKISQPEERKRLRQLAGSIKLPDNCGLIVRTAAEGCTTKEFNNDVQYLINLWKMISKNIKHSTAPALVHKELDLILRTIRDSFSEDVSRIVINSHDEYKRVMDFVKKFVPGAKRDIQFYQGKDPIFDKLGIQKDIDRAFRRRVWLKCGGYIVIDQTEALVAIDVNSGRHVSSESLEETVTQTNLEAADEIARQLRLRNVGGLVVIDFIDMRSKQNQREVLLRFQSALRKDKAKSSILPISEFGLVEMTRQRVKESIRRSVYDDCPYCKGRGTVKSLVSVCLDLQRTIKAQLMTGKVKDLRVEVSMILLPVIRENIEILQDLEDEYHARITVCGNSNLHIEEIRMYHHKTGRTINLNNKKK
jgi:ribonuclease G